MSPLSTAVAAALADRRRELGLTLEEVASRASMHRTSLGLVERNLRSLTIDSADRLCIALGLRLSDVIRAGEDSSRP